MRRNVLLCAGLVFAGLVHTASASPIFGTFNMTGTITVTATTITWKSDQGPGFAADFFTLSGGTNSFATANGQNQIMDLDISTEPVGTTFPPQTFIVFTQAPSLPDLDINYIYAGIGGSADCSNLVAAVGQTCTPANPGGSPFTFTNDAGNTSDAKFVLAGLSSDGLSSWSGIFTAQFNAPFQTVLQNAFGPNGTGSVTNSYSATATVVVTSVPEPSTYAFIFLGLGTVAAFRKLRRA
jgi:hypothetical protein